MELVQGVNVHTVHKQHIKNQGHAIYAKNGFIKDFVDLMQTPSTIEFMTKYIKSDLCWQSIFAYIQIYKKIEAFHRAKGKVIDKELASYILYIVFTQPKLRSMAIRTQTKPPPMRRKKRTIVVPDIPLLLDAVGST